MIAGTLLGLLAAILWSFANVAIQGSARRFGSFGALLWAQIIGGALVAGVALAVDGRPELPNVRGFWALGTAGGAACMAYVGLFESLRRGQLAVVAPIITVWAAISVATAVVIFDETLSAWALVGVALVVLGNAVLGRFGTSDETGGTDATAVGWALISAVGFGVMVPAIDVVGAEIGRLWTVPAVWAVELTLAVPVLAWLKQLGPAPKSAGDWLIASRVAIFEAGGFVSLSLALHLAPISIVTPCASLSTAGSVVLGVVLLRERLPPLALAGAVAASLGVLLVNL